MTAIGDDGLAVTVDAVCCRVWPVSPFSRIGRCGLCGQRPVIKNRDSDERAELPIHRTWAISGWTCSTCDGGGCLDCTDSAYEL